MKCCLKNGVQQNLRVLVLTRYGALGASSRLRFLQYFPYLQAAGIRVQWQQFFSDSALLARYRDRQYGIGTAFAAFGKRMQIMLSRRSFDVIWIEKEALPWCPLWLESFLLSGVPYVLDYDDAVFLNYELHCSGIVRSLYNKRISRLMARATLVVCGNSYLAKVACDAKAPWVEQLPTVIDLDRYPFQKKSKVLVKQEEYIPRIVWIGSPSTAKYISLLIQILQNLALRIPFVLRIIGAHFELPGVQVECLPWNEATEVSDITACDVGVMPLYDSAWERGKCGYKLIQYMACGLPVVASNVGVNDGIVRAGLNGYIARNNDEWLNALSILLSDSVKRKRFGQAGRKCVEDFYCIQKTGPVFTQLIKEVAIRR